MLFFAPKLKESPSQRKAVGKNFKGIDADYIFLCFSLTIEKLVRKSEKSRLPTEFRKDTDKSARLLIKRKDTIFYAKS